MKISAIETFVPQQQPNLCIVRLQGEDGLYGLGETFYGGTAVEAHIHDIAASRLLNLEEVTPQLAESLLAQYVGFQGSGVEIRASSAIDIALWDLLARGAGIPLCEMLGGPLEREMRIYNTCAGTAYVSSETAARSENWGLPNGEPGRKHEDLWAFLNEPARLARELLEQGYGGMKVWPFDLAAEQSGGGVRADLSEGCRILEEIRNEVGDELDLYVELHGLWTTVGARRLFKEIEQFSPAWVEDPLRSDNVDGFRRLAATTGIPIAAGETLAGQRGFRPLFESGALDIAIVDLCWCGGISEALRIASLAKCYGVELATHDCTGPISLAAGLHFIATVPGGFVQEVTRAFYEGWYRDLVTELPPIADGRIRPLDRPGLGLELHPRLLASDIRHRISVREGVPL